MLTLRKAKETHNKRDIAQAWKALHHIGCSFLFLLSLCYVHLCVRVSKVGFDEKLDFRIQVSSPMLSDSPNRSLKKGNFLAICPDHDLQNQDVNAVV